jgi:16S rRNA (cytosine967-C5)-methyltransferase
VRLSPDRKAAADLLLRLIDEEGRLDAWFGPATERLSPTERRRVHALVYGIVRNRTLLARSIDPYLKRPLHAQDREVQVALLLGGYELLWQDSVPDRAAVHQAVQLIRELGQDGRCGFINAVMRRLARRDLELELPDRAEEPEAWAEVAASHPGWLVTRMGELVTPAEVADWAEANNAEPPFAIRLRDPDDEAAIEAIGGRRLESIPGAVIVDDRPRGPIDQLPGFAEGRWWVQDPGAQAVVALLGLRPGASMLDACAAPGGKALAAAVEVGESGRVVAVDRSARRLGRLHESLDRLRMTGVEVVERDLLEEPWTGDLFDAVLLDAPCSGLGVIRRHPEIRWNRQPQDSRLQAARQRTLLASVADAVAPGGALVYSVCTFSREETDAVVDDFLAGDPRFELADPAAAAPGLSGSLLADRRLRTYPHRDDADAFFAVRLVRTEG